jgi:hypothetical protein
MLPSCSRAAPSSAWGRPPGVRVDTPHDSLVDEAADVAPVIHVIVDALLRLDVPGRDLSKVSRDFH